MSELMRRMIFEAERGVRSGVFGESLVTEHVGKACIQCVARIGKRGVSLHWFVNCKRSSKEKVEQLIREKDHLTQPV